MILRYLAVGFLYIRLILCRNAIGNLLCNPTTSATSTIDQEANLVKWCLGDMQRSVDSCEYYTSCPLDVVVETGKVISKSVQDFSCVCHPKILGLLAKNELIRKQLTSK